MISKSYWTTSVTCLKDASSLLGCLIIFFLAFCERELVTLPSTYFCNVLIDWLVHQLIGEILQSIRSAYIEQQSVDFCSCEGSSERCSFCNNFSTRPISSRIPYSIVRVKTPPSVAKAYSLHSDILPIPETSKHLYHYRLFHQVPLLKLPFRHSEALWFSS